MQQKRVKRHIDVALLLSPSVCVYHIHIRRRSSHCHCMRIDRSFFRFLVIKSHQNFQATASEWRPFRVSLFDCHQPKPKIKFVYATKECQLRRLGVCLCVRGCALRCVSKTYGFHWKICLDTKFWSNGEGVKPAIQCCLCVSDKLTCFLADRFVFYLASIPDIIHSQRSIVAKNFAFALHANMPELSQQKFQFHPTEFNEKPYEHKSINLLSH